MKFRPSRLALLVAVSGALGVSPYARASGLGLREGAVDWTGNAFTGGEAKAYDAGTVWTNPAGMALLEQSELDSSIDYIAPHTKFSGTNTNPLTGGYVSGSQGGNALAAAATGASFGVLVLSPRWRVGYSVNAPFGLRGSYDDNFVGRYQSLVTSITSINVGLMLSYKVNEHFAIGGGPVINYAQARLTQALNIPVLSPLTQQDPISDVHGDDVALGYNLGMMYSFSEGTRIGIDYHSRIRHKVNGTLNATIPGVYSAISPATAAALNEYNGPVKTSITLPDSVGIGFYHQINPRWAILGSLEWTDWSLFNQIILKYPSGLPASTIEEHWRNTWFAGIGTNYMVTPKLMLQCGASFDESPVTSSNRITRTPEGDNYDLGIGLKYALRKNISLQLAYAHIFSRGGKISSSSHYTPVTPSGTINGSYGFSTDTVSLGLATTF